MKDQELEQVAEPKAYCKTTAAVCLLMLWLQAVAFVNWFIGRLGNYQLLPSFFLPHWHMDLS